MGEIAYLRHVLEVDEDIRNHGGPPHGRAFEAPSEQEQKQPEAAQHPRDRYRAHKALAVAVTNLTQSEINRRTVGQDPGYGFD